MASSGTMRAVVLEKRGKASEGFVGKQLPLPQRGPKQVLVEVAATSVNTGDWKMRSGLVAIPLKLPKILGEDVAGVVVEAPEGSKFKKGDRVYAGTGQNLSGKLDGTYAEFVATDEHTLCHLPDGISFQDAGAVPVAGMTAWQALETEFPLQGKRVLIHGGAGGIGGFAIQIAKAHGAHVTTTCSTHNVEFVTKDLGADVAIDYTLGPWHKSVKDQRYDVILDLIGGSYEAASLKLLARGGKLVAVGATGPGKYTANPWEMVKLMLGAFVRWALGALRLGPKYRFMMLKCTASKGLPQLAELMTQGKLKVHFDKMFPLEEMVAAHEYCETGHVRGKVGISVKQL